MRAAAMALAVAVTPAPGGQHDNRRHAACERHGDAAARPDPVLTLSFAVNIIAATTRHDVTVRNVAGGTVDLGRVRLLPPTVTLQYRPLPAYRLGPYVGASLNHSIFHGEGGGRSPGIAQVMSRMPGATG